MGIKYSEEQQKVIDVRNVNVLVSAAAGSGKTAVLVERIIQLLTDKTLKLSIKQLLVVTFTKLAAQEMRERIAKGIEKAIEVAQGEQDTLMVRHLMKQLALLPTSTIMTLHSFCMQILRSHYPEIQLDPKFRLGNETELVLMQEELLDEILEDEYEKATNAFIQVIESFSPGKNDEPLKEIILQIYRFAMSNPWPKEWLYHSLDKLSLTSYEDIVNSPYVQVLIRDGVEAVELIEIYLEKIKDIMECQGGPTKYKDTYDAYVMFTNEFKLLLSKKDFISLEKTIRTKSIPTLNRSTKGFDKELAKEAKEHFDEIKKIVNADCSRLFIGKKILEEIQVIKNHTQEIVRLTSRFMDDYGRQKQQKNIIDFNDIEHFALGILYQQGNYSDVAQSYKEYFYEVLVDEYQDTNEVQEAIIQAISKQMQPRNNLFMVGDLKQSIYRFRLAKPEIFSRKYDTYSYAESNEIKIDLSKNFRSRKEVIEFSNHVFERIMSRAIGSVDYDRHAKLYFGATGFEDIDAFRPEIIFVEETESESSRTRLQAKVVSQKIHQLLLDESFKITDKSGLLRQVQLSDMCVLMRSPAGIIEELKEVFDAEKIAYHIDQTSGYFNAVEVQIVLNLLRILDNPYQDIPLVSVLRSTIAGFDEAELLEIRSFKEEGTFYESMMAFYEGITEESALYERMNTFIALYRELKGISKQVTLSHLIRQIYAKTGFPYIVSFMEHGQQRFTNLHYLEIHARKFEESSYKGLFNFIRYIDHITKYDIELPEPFSTSIREEQITLMSIHKSKGLEFPVVFVIDCQRQFNKMDLRKSFILHQELGFGCEYIDVERHIKKESIFTKAIKSVAEKELISEEMRLFYVALTRAKEKLILVATVKNYDEKGSMNQDKYARYISHVPSVFVAKANSLLDFILMSCPRESRLYTLTYIKETELFENEQFISLIADERRQILMDCLKRERDIEEATIELLFQPYHHIESTKLFTTVSVSEIKEKNQVPMEQDDAYVKRYEPRFLNDVDEKQQGTRFGTLMHKVLLHIPLKETFLPGEVDSFIDGLFQANILHPRDRDTIDVKKIITFTRSMLYQRMVLAMRAQNLYKEQPFVLGIYEKDDLRMIQGVIDVFFEENEEIVLVDYKTDYVQVGQEATLLKKYEVQLMYYKQAVEEILQKKVKQVYIYSLSLGRELLY